MIETFSIPIGSQTANARLTHGIAGCINTDISQLLQRFENIMATATVAPTSTPLLRYTLTKGPSHR